MEKAAAQAQEGHRDAERRHQELVRLRDKELFKQQNPGDYECPECLFITLKRGASRCPMCQAVIDKGHWTPIYEAERLTKERLEAEVRRKAEEWERGRPERERQAEQAAAEKRKQAAVDAQQRAEQAAADARQRRADNWRQGVMILTLLFLLFAIPLLLMLLDIMPTK